MLLVMQTSIVSNLVVNLPGIKIVITVVRTVAILAVNIAKEKPSRNG